MMILRTLIGSCAVLVLGVAGTGCEEMTPVEAPLQLEVAPEAPLQYAPGEAAALGQWVWTDPYGWLWVPADAQPYSVQGEPYVYVYTPTYGWTWFDSPWGWYGPDGGWGWAQPWYGDHWGPRYHAYAPPAVQVAPPAYRAGARATNVAPPAQRFAAPRPASPSVGPPAYRALPRATTAPGPAYRFAPPRTATVTPAYRALPRSSTAPPPAYHFSPSTPALPHVSAHPGGAFHGGRR